MDPSPTETNTEYWQDLSYCDKVKKLIIDGYLADCKFVVGPEDETAETIYGHKIFFIVDSPVFEKMFCGNFAEAQENPEIRLKDATPHDFKNLSYMIYTKSPSNLNDFALNEILTLHGLCDKYMITSISQICINHINNSTYLDKICIDDLITVFEFARDLTDKSDKSLLQSTRLVMQRKCKTVITRTDSLTEDAFYDYVQIISESNSFGYTKSKQQLHIVTVVNSYFVNNNLLEIVNNDKHADYSDESIENLNISRIKNLLQNLLKFIQFNEMEVKDFQNGPGTFEIINFKQKYHIISTLINKCCCIHPKGNCHTYYNNNRLCKTCLG